MKVGFFKIIFIITLLQLIACDNNFHKMLDDAITLSIPGVLTIVAQDSALQVSWSSVKHATSYELWYHVENDSSLAVKVKEEIKDTEQVITELTNGTRYYVWLRAISSSGSSDLSPVASAVPSLQCADATRPGDLVYVSVGDRTMQMRFANNQSSITFPTGVTDASSATLGKKFFMQNSELINEVAVEILQWAYDNDKFSSDVSDHNGLNSKTIKYGDQELLDLDASENKIIFDGSGSFSVASSSEKYPVIFVSWYGAIMFCNWLTEMQDGNSDNLVYSNITRFWSAGDTLVDSTKNGYRLPSSNEWEFAARFLGDIAPTTGANLDTEVVLLGDHYWTPGNYASGAIADYTNNNETKAVAVYDYTDPDLFYRAEKALSRGAASANFLGIFDMSGNVREWCFTASGAARISRGGSWRDINAVMSLGLVNTLYTPDHMDPEGGLRFVKSQ